MKLRILMSTMILALLSFVSNAQTTITKNNRTIATKGYYSIGNNSEKLASTATVKTVPLFTQPVARKGYYSVESNRRKLPVLQGIDLLERKTTPVKKGYYGIGNNNQKLK
jgi:hypothetical protein